ncbi:hypothetical protein GSI_06970 [Ganoderma sinense ZZ0214-1]|uniref:Reverse transcriptase domain-containing protein n=1 Tax=Ganoderma sinense ZZ0214-1 TaxID=1077348 RepID=A0A2G8SAM5_9APHY|nr:hypothetical protein GSI_06970 [Ganoderma sinense ZZ0214-1]
MAIKDYREKVVFVVTDIENEDVIIGLDWLRKHNPEVDWERGSLRLSRCPEACPAHQKASKPVETKARDTEVRLMARNGPHRVRKAKTVGRIRAAMMVEEEEEDKPPPPGFLPEWDGTEESLLDALATGRTLRNAPKLFVSATYTYSQQLAEQEYQKKEIRPVEEIVPKQYHKYLRVFSKEASERLPDHGPYDHAIELVPDARMFHSKVYPLSPSEQVELDKFINENLAKGYIQESKLPMSSPFFFVKKKDGSLRPVQDYRRLNDITIKNRYLLPLVSDLMDRLKKAKYFTKLDICWCYGLRPLASGRSAVGTIFFLLSMCDVTVL